MSAEWIGILFSAAFGLGGLAYAYIANQHSARAIELAQSAEDRAQRLEDLSLERRDVTWEHRRVDDDPTLSFTNIGSDPAYAVVLIVDPEGDGRRREEVFGTVEPAGRIGMKLNDLAREAKARYDQSVDSPQILLTPGFSVRARITWTSNSGVPSTKSWDFIPFAV